MIGTAGLQDAAFQKRSLIRELECRQKISTNDMALDLEGVIEIPCRQRLDTMLLQVLSLTVIFPSSGLSCLLSHT